MIIDWILNLFYLFSLGISLIVSSFGEVSTNNAITISVVSFKSYYMSLNEFIPLDTLVAVIAFDIAFETSVFIYKLVRWGYKKVPAIS